MDSEKINIDLVVLQMLEDNRWVENWIARQCQFNPGFPAIISTLLLEKDSEKKDQKESMLWERMKIDAYKDEPELKARSLGL